MVDTPTNRGNRHTLRGADPADKVTLIEHQVQAGDNPEIPSGWVITLNALQLVRSGAGNEVNSALARITWGSGGSRSIVEVTVNPSSVIYLPGESFSVELLWDPALPQFYTLPTSVTVAGLARRGYGTTNARRISYQPFQLNGSSVTVEVPPYARDWTVLGNPSVDCLFSSEFIYAWGPGNAPNISGLEILRIMMNGGRMPIPAGVTQMFPQALSAFNTVGGNVSIGDPWGIDWGIVV